MTLAERMRIWCRRLYGLTKEVLRQARGAMRRLPGGAWLLGWTDPLHVARRLLRQAVQEHDNAYNRHWRNSVLGDD